MRACGDPWKARLGSVSPISFFYVVKGSTEQWRVTKREEYDNYNCVLYSQNVDECLMPLFFECSFSKWCWRFVKVQ
jgi:hypothetical protein